MQSLAISRSTHISDTTPERTGMIRTRDSDILAMFVFLQRLELDNNNGRKRGRAYLDFLRGFFPEQTGDLAPAGSSLIVP